MARAVLFKGAKDQHGRHTRWLRTEHIKTYCEHAGVDYEEYCKAIEFMAGKSPEQQKFLLTRLKKTLAAYKTYRVQCIGGKQPTRLLLAKQRGLR